MKVRGVVRVLPFFLAVAFLAMTASVALGSTMSLSVNANGRVFQAAAASPALVTSWTPSGATVDTAAVQAWVAKVALSPGVNHKVVNYSSKIDKKKKKLVFSHNDGFSLNQPASVLLIANFLSAQTTDTFPAHTIVLPKNAMTAPKKRGMQILVVKSQRKFYIYQNDKVIKTFRCAIGMPSYPTPTGTFHIGKKVKNPTWRNGYASWSKNMPSYIGPGPNNPLGLFAMYVYTKSKGGSDTGVRFHGIPRSEYSSIGHAASHGCLRMMPASVKDFFGRVKVGTAVFIIK
jgi:lipoprotein-anchoring transpeptidase ErfK/SrfK